MLVPSAGYLVVEFPTILFVFVQCAFVRKFEVATTKGRGVDVGAYMKSSLTLDRTTYDTCRAVGALRVRSLQPEPSLTAIECDPRVGGYGGGSGGIVK